VELDAKTHLYSLKFSRIAKIEGINNPFATIEWPEIQIPHALISNLFDKTLKCNLIKDTGTWQEHHLAFYERNQTRRGLDFKDSPDTKEDFLRYVVELQCMNPVVVTKKTLLPTLKDLAEGANSLLAACKKTRLGAQKRLGPNHTRNKKTIRHVPGRPEQVRARDAGKRAPQSQRSNVHKAQTRSRGR